MRGSLLCLSLLLCTIQVAAVIIDEANILDEKIENEIEKFNQRSAIPLSVITTAQTYDLKEQAADNFETLGLTLLLFYSPEEGAVVVQPIDAGIPEPTILRLLSNYQHNLPALIREVMASMGEWQRETTGPKPVCALLRDGTCDSDCAGTDLDCLCGNTQCEVFETPETCATDCDAAPELWCAFRSDGVCSACTLRDIDCPVEPGMIAGQQRPAFYIGITLAALMLIMIVVLRIWRKR
ncbi:MAG TPA: hypothetical protein VJK52_03280 [Candidatus Nanoarchaeia archaeon]|nr:hypothetical protein [Candidatus Nanoarchaeia archaeon]